jgi:hypothetical protein
MLKWATAVKCIYVAQDEVHWGVVEIIVIDFSVAELWVIFELAN